MPYQKPDHIKTKLKKTYRRIARSFSDTRSHPWPEFSYFKGFIPEGSKILDLGCGNGRFAGFLRNKRVDYTGVDFCPEMLEIARKRYPKLEFIEQDISELDLSKKFDVVISIAAFHHLPSIAMRKKCLRKIWEHLEDEGILLISVWDLWQWKYWRQHLLAIGRFFTSVFRSSARDLFIPFGKTKVERYYHAFRPYEIKNLLEKSGFKVEESKTSRHNLIFVCKKDMLNTSSTPVFINEKVFRTALQKPSAITTCNEQR